MAASALARIRRLPQGLSLEESFVVSDCLDSRSQTCVCNLLQITPAMLAKAFNRVPSNTSAEASKLLNLESANVLKVMARQAARLIAA